MRSIKSAVVFLAKTLGIAAAAFLGNAWAGPADPSVSAELNVINAEVTYSRPAAKQEEALITYAAYRLTVWNNSTNVLNRIYLNATAANVNGTDPVLFDDPPLADIAASAYTCSGFNASTLNCTTSLSIPPGGSTSFVVVARAPADGQKIRIVWSAGGHEGNGQGNGCCAVTGPAAETTLIDATSGTFTTNAQSFIKNTGGKLFTGDRWITRAEDPITTLVIIPGFNTEPYDLGQISETPSTDPNCAAQGRFTTCYQSFISVPRVDFSQGSGSPTNFFTIVVRLDSAVINRTTKIDDVDVRYDGESVYMCGNTFPEQYPCIVDRRVLRNQNSVENYTSDLKNDYQWTIKHFRNGGYAFF